MNLNGNGKCKICRSPFRDQIDKMIIEGQSYSQIIAAFPQLNLNKANISNHKKHLNPAVLQEAREKYHARLEELAEDVVDEIEALDAVITKAFRIFQTFDGETKPRVVEVWTNTLLRAIKLKKEIFSGDEPVKRFLDDLFLNSNLDEEVESYE